MSEQNVWVDRATTTTPTTAKKTKLPKWDTKVDPGWVKTHREATNMQLAVFEEELRWRAKIAYPRPD